VGLAAVVLSACTTIAPVAPEPAPTVAAPAPQPPQRDDPPVAARPPRAEPAPPSKSAAERRQEELAYLSRLADPVPRAEPLRSWANRPYVNRGRKFVPMTERRPFSQRGVASWYGHPFHGRKTAIGERYDMRTMTAAHPTLPLPSYVRVTSLETGRTIIVRVNDRGPFAHGRIIDLSFAAAAKLGFTDRGVTPVEISLVIPEADTGVTPISPALGSLGAPAR
jgi:rare lipoprotein A